MSDAARSVRRPERRGSSVRRWAVAAATLVVACTASTGAPDPGPKVETTFPPSDPQEEKDFSEGLSVVDLDPGERSPAGRPVEPPTGGRIPDDVAIDHVVFIIKENRTFDHFLREVPGADGATTGLTFDGEPVPLTPAPDVMSEHIAHGFWSGLYAIDGGRMDGFDVLTRGETLLGYSQFDREGIPNYWRYADRFVLADRFFSGVQTDLPGTLVHRGGAVPGRDRQPGPRCSPSRRALRRSRSAPAGVPQEIGVRRSLTSGDRPDRRAQEPDRRRQSRQHAEDRGLSQAHQDVLRHPDSARPVGGSRHRLALLLVSRDPDRRCVAGDPSRARGSDVEKRASERGLPPRPAEGRAGERHVAEAPGLVQRTPASPGSGPACAPARTRRSR